MSTVQVTQWSPVVINSALTYLWFFQECATPPHVHPMSRYIAACDKLYQSFPVLVLQATDGGVGRPGRSTLGKPRRYTTLRQVNQTVPWQTKLHKLPS